MTDDVNVEVLDALAAVDQREVPPQLRDRLVEEAERDGVLDVAYRILDSTIGPLLLAATEIGLVRVDFAAKGSDDALGELASTVSPRILHAPKRLDAVASELEEYLAGKRRDFDVPLDFRLSKGFRREVLARLLAIEYGTTSSYAAVAAAAGSPRAMRAVGTACATNPLPLVVPCHRVVRSDGSIGQYAGGAAIKQRLIALERGRSGQA